MPSPTPPPQSSTTPPPPGFASPQARSVSSCLVHVDALAAALSRLGIDADASLVLQTVKEEELKRAPERLAAARRAAILKLAAEAPNIDPAVKSTISYPAAVVENFTQRMDPVSKQRRKRLWDMTEEAFPTGRPFPDPPSSPPSTPLPPASSYLVRVDDLAAALSRLGIDADASLVLQTVKEEELKRAPERLAPRRAALIKLAAEAPSIDPAVKSTTSLKPTFVKSRPQRTDPVSKQRRKIIWDRAEEAFPTRQPFPNPYVT